MLIDDAAAVAAAAVAEDHDEVTSPVQGGQRRTEAVLILSGCPGRRGGTIGMSKSRGPVGDNAFGLDW